MDMLSYSKEREPAIEDTDLNQICPRRGRVDAGPGQGAGRQAGDRAWTTSCRWCRPIRRASCTALLEHRRQRPGRRGGPAQAAGRRGDARWKPDGAGCGSPWSDNGIGIPPEKLSDIFKPFVSTKGAKGTGLGLAVSRKILREHGGDILVESQPGKGSRFMLRLPLKSPLSLDPGSTIALPPDE